MRIVVVGGNGFIGSHFVDIAARAGHEIVVSGNNPLPRFAHGQNFQFLPGGIAALARNHPVLGWADVICHFASSSIPSSSNLDPVADINNNLTQTVALLEAMKVTGNRKIVFLSSGGAIYGRPRHTPIAEDHPTNPMSSYGIVKLAVEKYIALYTEQYGFDAAIVRPANPYGPGQGKHGQLGAITTFLDLAATGKTAHIWGDGTAIRDFVYVSDLCNLLITIVEQKSSGTFNCGSGLGTSLIEVISVIEMITRKKILREHLPSRAFDPPAVVLDISRAHTELGWVPQTDLFSGISRMYHDNGSFLSQSTA